MKQRWMGLRVSRLATMAALAAVGVSSLMGAALAVGKQDFTLHNETGVVINKLYISAHDKDEWEEDVLGVDQLADGEETEVTFESEEEADDWDIRVEDTDGNAIEWKSLTLSEITDITLRYEDGKATAETKNGDEPGK